MCSCPPFECTCPRWNFQGSPKLANSPPFPAKKLNFYGPAFCEIPPGTGMQSLSIEIDTNKHINHPNNYGLYPPDLQNSLPPSFVSNVPQMSTFPIVQNQSSCYEPRQSDIFPTSGSVFRDSSAGSTMSRRSCDRLEPTSSAQLFLPSKRYRSSDTFGFYDKPCSETDAYGSPPKRIKSEHISTMSDCSRNSIAQNTHSRPDSGDVLFEDSMDLLNSPFETDIYTSLVQRFNDGNDTDSQSQTVQVNPTSTTSSAANFAELKSTQSLDTRAKSCQDIYQSSLSRNVDNQYRNCSTEPIQTTSDSSCSANNSYFPLHSQCMMPDSPVPSCNYDYDQRLPHQQLSSQSQYCNHSINITLRYK